MTYTESGFTSVVIVVTNMNNLTTKNRKILLGLNAKMLFMSNILVWAIVGIDIQIVNMPIWQFCL